MHWSHALVQLARTRAVSVAAVIVALASAACADERSRLGGWIGHRETRGDTVIVTTSGGSVWSEATLVEDLRIGVLEGPDELMFGQVDELAPDAHGGVYVFDGLVPALRYYDADGKYVRTLGGKGSGPGEYRDVALGVAVRGDGRIVLRDPRNHRINVYHPDGRPSDHWPVASGLFTGNALVVDTADHMYLKILVEQPRRNEPWKIGLLHLDANGTLIDTIQPPGIPNEPTGGGGIFIPAKEWARSPFGYTVVGVPRDYSFDIRAADGGVTRVVKAYEPVALHAEERAELEAINEWMKKTQGQFMTSEVADIPSIKPPYSSIAAGADRRIWIRRHVPAEKRPTSTEPRPDGEPPQTWREPAVYDVFEADGVYLGAVRLPPRTAIHWFGREYLWGISVGELDENYVVRLRLNTR